MRQQRGMALLVVLLLLAVMVTLASGMTQRYRLEWSRTYHQQVQQQNYGYLLGSESLISKVLTQDFKDDPNKNTLSQYWATENQVFPVDGATLQGVVRDAQACFNLNALRDDSTDETPSVQAVYRAKVFRQLLINLKVEEARAEQITAAVQDWLDSNTTVRQWGAEDNEYAALTVPYLPANRAMQDVSELRAVMGVDAALYRQLLPQICVLPVNTLQINVNTLRPLHAPLLAALFLDTLNADDARTLLEQRPREGWDSVTAFLEQDALSQTAVAGNQVDTSLAVKSAYFLATLQATTEGNSTRLVSLFERQGNNQATVIRRHFGGLE